MNYKPIFDPSNETNTQASLAILRSSPMRLTGGDDTNTPYIFDKKDTLAVNLALATGRPLLLYGPTGCGKSSLAKAVAKILGSNFLSTVITSRSTARDLLWKTDIVQRLAEAQVQRPAEAQVPVSDEGNRDMGAMDIRNFIRPGVLWWAYNYQDARTYCGKDHQPPATFVPGRKGDGTECAETDHTVLLLDEIDKADPDLPNDLLTPIGNQKFTIEETGENISLRPKDAPHENPFLPPLLIITSNQERELPNTFVRRCVVHQMEQINEPDRLVNIALSHFSTQLEESIIRTIAERTAQLVINPRKENTRKPSTAEFLDTVRACVLLKQENPETDFFGSDDWEWIVQAVLHKSPAQVVLP